MNKTETLIRADIRVSEISDERRLDSGIWLYLRPGLCNGEDCAAGHHPQSCVHAVHEQTWTECLKYLRRVVECNCSTCTSNLCRAFALCTNEATTTIPNVILGDVPACQRCADKLTQ